MPDRVKVYGSAGKITLCLAPGQRVASNKAANDKGASHEVSALLTPGRTWSGPPYPHLAGSPDGGSGAYGE